MELFLKASAGVLLSLVLILVTGKHGQDIGTVLGMAVCAMVGILALTFLSPVLNFLREIQNLGNLEGETVQILLKAMGIGLTAQIAAAICDDCGNSSIGKALHFLAGAVILSLSIPVFTALLDLIREILGAL